MPDLHSDWENAKASMYNIARKARDTVRKVGTDYDNWVQQENAKAAANSKGNDNSLNNAAAASSVVVK